MSDENAEVGPHDEPPDQVPATSGTASPELGTGGEDLAELSDPALASRLETIHRTMSTLGMRIDALVTSTTSYRAALTDRLTEYADLVTKLTRTQATDLEEYRRANERVLADLRRGLSTSEETLERVGARIDSMLTDAESSDDSARRMLAEVRGILDAQESLGRFLTESLDQFADQVLDRLTASEQAASSRLEALQAALGGPGAHGSDEQLAGLHERLAGIDARLVDVASADPTSALVGRFETLHVAIDDLSNRIVTQVSEANRELAGDNLDTRALAEQVDRVERELTTTGQVITESWGELAGLRAKVDAVLETSANQSGAVSGTLEQLKETMLDMASGEVVGALWDEFRSVRASVQALVDQTGHTAEPAAVEALRVEVGELNDAVRALLEQAEVVEEESAAPGDDGTLAALAADVNYLRQELSQGMVVEPSEAFAGSVERLRGDLDELRASVTELQVPPADAGGADEEIRAVRTGVEDIIGRLDEGLVLADDVSPGAGATVELADQLATLRDLVSTEFDAVRHLFDAGGAGVDLDALGARLDRFHDELAELAGPAPDATSHPEVLESLADIQEALSHLLDRSPSGSVDLTGVTNALAQIENDLAALGDRVDAGAAPGGGSYAQIDPDTVDLLREEIRGAGTVPADLLEQLRGELKALRRRIKVRAESEIFTPEDLDSIAEAVARRLRE